MRVNTQIKFLSKGTLNLSTTSGSSNLLVDSGSGSDSTGCQLLLLKFCKQVSASSSFWSVVVVSCISLFCAEEFETSFFS